MSPDDQQQCQLLDSFGIAVQLCLAGIAFSTLLLKRQREQPQRPFRTWGFDVSKQVVGGFVIHSLNLLLSYLSGRSVPEKEVTNACVWYWLHIFVDTTLGTALLWLFLENGQRLLRQLGHSGFQTGVYGTPPFRKQLRRWAKQLGLYLVCLILMKCVVLLLFSLCPWLETVGAWILSWMGHPKMQAVFVMLIFPLVMNIMQFWIIDTIVKHNSLRTPIYLDDALDEDVLIPIYEEDDDDESLTWHPENEDDNAPLAPSSFFHPQALDQDAISLSSSLQPIVPPDIKRHVDISPPSSPR
ncbi:hypothetical protein DM01DRAFT_1298252 [Hesseltinella vesiculosa]|uniref:Vacuolar membrane protein n=1 Tax=Hesseltinella vesiculosa TaxID=101127 RepID=A0A1X2GYN7_9FUNG|nr:hypothetical protein DM01DRAFT_1298252 [Hesseltinella vesiculosa]